MEFYENLPVLESNMASSKVHGIEILFDKVSLGKILQVPSVGLEKYIKKEDEGYVLTLKFTNSRVSDAPRKVLKGETSPFLKLLMNIITR